MVGLIQSSVELESSAAEAQRKSYTMVCYRDGGIHPGQWYSMRKAAISQQVVMEHACEWPPTVKGPRIVLARRLCAFVCRGAADAAVAS